MRSRRNKRGAGYDLPERDSDCTGTRPAWYPFQIEVEACNEDEAPLEFPENARGTAIPTPPAAFPWAPTE